jgi:hypothetical protein
MDVPRSTEVNSPTSSFSQAEADLSQVHSRQPLKTGSIPKTQTQSKIQNERYVTDEYDCVDSFNCTEYSDG